MLAFPANGALIFTDSIECRWRQTPAADRYWFAVATDSAFVSAVVDSTVTDTLRAIRSLVGGQTYWWKVRAGNAAGWGAFSETRTLARSTTSVAERAALPNEFALSQNFPNPFNPTTTIEFALPREEYVTLEVFNLVGARVALLVEGKRAEGYYTETFNANEFASGVYFYRLRAGTYVHTKKLVLMK